MSFCSHTSGVPHLGLELGHLRTEQIQPKRTPSKALWAGAWMCVCVNCLLPELSGGRVQHQHSARNKATARGRRASLSGRLNVLLDDVVIAGGIVYKILSPPSRCFW